MFKNEQFCHCGTFQKQRQIRCCGGCFIYGYKTAQKVKRVKMNNAKHSFEIVALIAFVHHAIYVNQFRDSKPERARLVENKIILLMSNYVQFSTSVHGITTKNYICNRFETRVAVQSRQVWTVLMCICVYICYTQTPNLLNDHN